MGTFVVLYTSLEKEIKLVIMYIILQCKHISCQLLHKTTFFHSNNES